MRPPDDRSRATTSRCCPSAIAAAVAASSAATRSSVSLAIAVAAKSGGPKSSRTSPRQRARASLSNAADPIGFTDSERLLTPMDETLEDVRVEVVGVEDEAVPGRCRLESVVGARGRQHPAHRGDVGTQRRRGTLGCGLAPQRRDQPVATAWSVAAEEKQSQQLPSPWAAQGHGPVRGIRSPAADPGCRSEGAW